MAKHKNKTEVVPNISFPNPFASDEIKDTDAYGVQYGQAIQLEWFHRNAGSTSGYQDKSAEYHRLRLYARGEQDTEIYKQLIAGGKETSWTNYDWRPIQVVPKFMNLITNQMQERLFSVRAEATDKFSSGLKDGHKKYLEDLVKAKPLIQDAKDILGVDIAPEGGIDAIMDNQDEIDLHMQLKYKPSIEIASELAIDATLKLNDYNETQSTVLHDLATIGIGAIKHYTDPNKGIVVEYVDPANLVYSYPKRKNFRDVHYYGEMRRITISELKRITGDRFTEDELLDLAGQTINYNNYQTNETYSGEITTSMFETIKVDILDFTYKTTNSITYKKKYKNNGGFSLSKKPSTFRKKSKEYSGYDVIKKDIDVWYKGSMILGTKTIFNYGKCSNMIRPKGFLNIAYSNYIIYAPDLYQNRTRSLLKRIIPYVDQMQQVHIKIQQTIAKAKPNGVYIDVAGLEAVDMGNGNVLEPLELLAIYNDTGNVFGSSLTRNGDINPGKQPITELHNSVTKNLSEFIATWNHYLNLVRDAIGIPQGADASLPHPDTGLGVQEQAILTSNTATRHLLDGILNMTERLGEGVSLRLSDIFKRSDLKNFYINHIGEVNVNVLEALKKYHLFDLGIHIELKPDIRDKQGLEANINQALAKDLITLDDAIDIRNISNIKLANEYLKMRRSKREKARKDHEKELVKLQSDGQIQVAQAASQARLQEAQTKSQMDLTLEDKKAESAERKILAEEQSRMRLMDKEYQLQLGIKVAETNQANQKEKYKEDRKDNRQDRQNTQGSKMIEQRDTGSPSLNFESEQDHISGGIGNEDFLTK